MPLGLGLDHIIRVGAEHHFALVRYHDHVPGRPYIWKGDLALAASFPLNVHPRTHPPTLRTGSVLLSSLIV
jgi:hypothetical protein